MNIEALMKQSAVVLERPTKEERDYLVRISRKIWGYLGYAGLIDPWHDKDIKLMFKISGKSIKKTLQDLEQSDISLEAYCIIILSLAPHQRFETIGKWFSAKSDKTWIKKLRTQAGSSEALDELAYILLMFMELQIEHKGKVQLHRKSLVQTEIDGGTLCMEAYHRLLERIAQLQSKKIEPELWLTGKFAKAIEAFPEDQVKLRTITNFNGLEPDLKQLQAQANDEWRELRAFLGLSMSCEFVDGFIPKGWTLSSDDRDDAKRIVKINGDGYYYYEDGTQRRGKRHYAKNAYFVIKCDPANFHLFQDKWFDPRLLALSPTWMEYNTYAARPGLWDEKGLATNGRGNPVKWRKN